MQYIFIVLFYLYLNSLNAREKIIPDSLFSKLQSSDSDTSKAITFSKIGDLLVNINPDSSLYFYKKALELNIKAEYEKNIAANYKSMGKAYYYNGTYDKAIEYYVKSLNIAEKQANKTEMLKCYNNIGLVYSSQNIYDKALNYYFKSLKISEELNDKKGLSGCYNNIGNVYKNLGNYDKAEEFYLKSLKISEELKDIKGMSLIYNNIGNVLFLKGKYDESQNYYYKALKIFEDTKNKHGLATSYINFGSIYFEKNDFANALRYFIKALRTSEEIEDKNGITTVYGNLADIYIKSKNYDKSLEYAFKGLNLAKEMNILLLQRENYRRLAETYDSLRNYQKAYQYHRLYKKLNDSVYNSDNSRQIKQIENRYQIEKKQLEIDNLTKDQALKEKEIAKQRLLKNAFIIGFIMMLIFSYFVYHSRRKLRKAVKLLGFQHNEILEKNEELQQQKEEIETQRNALEELNHNLADKVIEEVNKNRDKDMILINQSKHAAMGEMIGNIAHQWRQPLNAVGVLIQNMQEAHEYNELTDEYLAKNVSKGMELIKYMSQTITDFRDFFRNDKEKIAFNISDTIKKAISFVEASFKNNNIIIVENVDDKITYIGFPNEIIQIVLNFLNNAKDALLERKIQNPKVMISLLKERNTIILKIADNAGGIPENIIDKIFDPYFTTKAADKGTGLGLYMAKYIIEKNYNGNLSVKNIENGAEFEIQLNY